MLSKNQLKYFSSLSQKKFRLHHGRFLAEGEKIVREITEERGFFPRGGDADSRAPHSFRNLVR